MAEMLFRRFSHILRKESDDEQIDEDLDDEAELLDELEEDLDDEVMDELDTQEVYEDETEL